DQRQQSVQRERQGADAYGQDSALSLQVVPCKLFLANCGRDGICASSLLPHLFFGLASTLPSGAPIFDAPLRSAVIVSSISPSSFLRACAVVCGSVAARR